MTAGVTGGRSHPCKGLCTTTTGDTQCRGCGRTVEEIRDWNTYSYSVRAKIMDDLPRRLKASSKG